MNETPFIYRASAQPDVSGFQRLVAATLARVNVRDLDVDDVFTASIESILTGDDPLIDKAIVAAQLIGVPEPYCGHAEVLACPWASVHTDEGYDGSQFVCLILATGPSDYYMGVTVQNQLVGTTRRADRSTFSSRRFLRTGDVVVFDPTQMHWALPLHPHPDCMLVMLQWVVPGTPSAISAKIPASPQDCNQESLNAH